MFQHHHCSRTSEEHIFFQAAVGLVITTYKFFSTNLYGHTSESGLYPHSHQQDFSTNRVWTNAKLYKVSPKYEMCFSACTHNQRYKFTCAHSIRQLSFPSHYKPDYIQYISKFHNHQHPSSDMLTFFSQGLNWSKFHKIEDHDKMALIQICI